MDQDLKRRVVIFAQGAGIGTLLSVGLFMFWMGKKQAEPEVEETREVVVSTCDLKAGQILEESCTERRAVVTRFIPPQSLEAGRLPYALNRTLKVDVPKGHAFRSVDFADVE